MKKILSFVLLAAVVLAGCKKPNNGGDQPAEEAAYEIFNHSIQQMEEQWTMVYNATVNNNDYSKFSGFLPYESLCENVGTLLAGISQTIEIKKTWAEECYASSTLAANLQEILNTFKTDIQEPLEQAKNLFDDEIAIIEGNPTVMNILTELANKASLVTMTANVTIYNEEDASLFGDNPDYQDIVRNVSSLISAVEDNIQVIKDWINESYSKGTLEAEAEDIMGQFEVQIEIPLTQALHLYEDGVKPLKENKLYEELAMELEGLQVQWTQVYMATVNNSEHSDAAEAAGKASQYQEICDAAGVHLSAVSQTLETKSAWVESSYQNGTLSDDAEEIYASFEPDVQIPLTQILNVYNDAYAELMGEEK